jgi:hypothetical protein
LYLIHFEALTIKQTCLGYAPRCDGRHGNPPTEVLWCGERLTFDHLMHEFQKKGGGSGDVDAKDYGDLSMSVTDVINAGRLRYVNYKLRLRV